MPVAYPIFFVCVSYVQQGTTELAIVLTPLIKDCYWAVRGGGAFLNGNGYESATSLRSNLHSKNLPKTRNFFPAKLRVSEEPSWRFVTFHFVRLFFKFVLNHLIRSGFWLKTNSVRIEKLHFHRESKNQPPPFNPSEFN